MISVFRILFLHNTNMVNNILINVIINKTSVAKTNTWVTVKGKMYYLTFETEKSIIRKSNISNK